MSSKTEILGFEDSWKKNRHVFESTKSLAKVMYLDGQQSKQSDIDELQKRVKELELINFDSELHFDAAKEHIDRLQKRIDGAIYYLQHIESAMWEEQVEHVLMILKGDSHEP